MLWQVKGTPKNPDWLDLEPIEVLYDFDGPRIFICKDGPGNTYLAYLCGDDRNTVRYLVVPCSDSLKERLISGKINLRDALSQGKAWVFDLDNDWKPRSASRVNVDDLPEDALPEPGVMLYAHLTPIVKLTM